MQGKSASDDLEGPGEPGVLVTGRRNYRILAYITTTYDELGAKLITEPATYERYLTMKRIRRVLGRYRVTEQTLGALASARYVSRIQGATGRTLFVPTDEGRIHLQHLREYFQGLTREIRSFSSRLGQRDR
jgi:DNA-binding PadR family transcriptional regulator